MSIVVPMMSEVPNPSELLLELLTTYVDPNDVPGGFAVGPITHEAQQAGGVSIMLAGRPRVVDGVVFGRLQLRCIARTLAEADRISFVVDYVLQHLRRKVARQASTGRSYLIHFANPDAGPSHHRDSEATWESLLFCEMMIGEDPVV